MRNKTVLETNIDELLEYQWLHYMKGKEVKFIGYSKASVKEAAENFGVSEALIEMLRDSFDNMAEAFVEKMKQDLEDVWMVAKCAHNMTEALAEMHGINVHDGDEEDDEDGEGDGGDNWESCEDCEDKEDCPEYKEHQDVINKLFTPPDKKNGDKTETDN